MSRTDDEMTVVELEPRMTKGKAQAFWMGELDDKDREVWIWLPLSQITVEEIKDSPLVEVSIPEWLAIEKELV